MKTVVTARGGLGEKLDAATRQHGLRVEDVVAETRGLSARERLNIYAAGYVLRLLDCMRADFPVLRSFLGDAVFDAFAKAYLITQPPSSHSLYDLGGAFPKFLEETKPNRDRLDAETMSIPGRLDAEPTPIPERADAERIRQRFDAEAMSIPGRLDAEPTPIPERADAERIRQRFDAETMSIPGRLDAEPTPIPEQADAEPIRQRFDAEATPIRGRLDAETLAMLDLPPELARLERARAEVMRARGTEDDPPAAEPLSPFAAFGDGPMLQVNPCLRLLEMKFPLVEFLRSSDKGEHPEPPPPRTSFVAVSRSHYRVYVEEISLWQFAFLKACERPTASYPAVQVAALESGRDPDQVLAEIALWLPIAFELGFLREA